MGFGRNPFGEKSRLIQLYFLKNAKSGLYES